MFAGDVGYEIKGWSEPQFKRVPPAHNDDDIELDIPNGDLDHGRKVYNQACAGCHDLGRGFPNCEMVTLIKALL